MSPYFTRVRQIFFTVVIERATSERCLEVKHFIRYRHLVLFYSIPTFLSLSTVGDRKRFLTTEEVQTEK